MKWSSIGVKLAGLAAGFLLVGMLGGTASAYPPPTGSVSMSTSSSTPAAGTSITISTTVLNQFGSPAFGLSCTFEVISQPGSGAAVDASPKLTDDNGVASTTLNVGTTSGSIVVGANCGTLSGQVLVNVQSGAPGAVQLRLPATGTGSEEAPSGLMLLAALMATGISCVAAGQSLRIAAKRARGS
ncbi:MAG: Ig-like domain-containing protein [Acidobacteria bacterium]|nr:Ig-like domain-containing protein [Acidobacteriota bacterium]